MGNANLLKNTRVTSFDEERLASSLVKSKPMVIDLFAGCGGLSEGFYKQGYRALLHLELEKVFCETLKTRMR